MTWQEDRRLQIHDFILQRSVDSRLTIGNFSHSRQTEHSTCNHDSQNGFSHDHDSQGILKNSKSRVTKMTLPPPPLPTLINGLCPFHVLFRREHVALMVCDRFKQLVQDQSYQNIMMPHVITRIREEARASINYVVNYSKSATFTVKCFGPLLHPHLQHFEGQTLWGREASPSLYLRCSALAPPRNGGTTLKQRRAASCAFFLTIRKPWQ